MIRLLHVSLQEAAALDMTAHASQARTDRPWCNSVFNALLHDMHDMREVKRASLQPSMSRLQAELIQGKPHCACNTGRSAADSLHPGGSRQS